MNVFEVFFEAKIAFQAKNIFSMYRKKAIRFYHFHRIIIEYKTSHFVT